MRDPLQCQPRRPALCVLCCKGCEQRGRGGDYGIKAGIAEPVAHGNVLLQAGVSSRPRDVSIPAGLPRLFKSSLDWNLFSPLLQHLGNRQVGARAGTLGPATACRGRHAFKSYVGVAQVGRDAGHHRCRVGWAAGRACAAVLVVGEAFAGREAQRWAVPREASQCCSSAARGRRAAKEWGCCELTWAVPYALQSKLCSCRNQPQSKAQPAR